MLPSDLCFEPRLHALLVALVWRKVRPGERKNTPGRGALKVIAWPLVPGTLSTSCSHYGRPSLPTSPYFHAFPATVDWNPQKQWAPNESFIPWVRWSCHSYIKVTNAITVSRDLERTIWRKAHRAEQSCTKASLIASIHLRQLTIVSTPAPGILRPLLASLGTPCAWTNLHSDTYTCRHIILKRNCRRCLRKYSAVV